MDRDKTEKLLQDSVKANTFSPEERKAYFKKKWRSEHVLLLTVLCIIVLLIAILPFLLEKPWLAGFAPIAAIVAHCYQNNKMMAYVEHKLYD